MEFFVGIIPEDKHKFLVHAEKNLLDIKNEYDDPHGYYTYIIEGTWEDYRLLSLEANHNSFVRSLEHFEE
jgi:hypothetical protein